MPNIQLQVPETTNSRLRMNKNYFYHLKLVFQCIFKHNRKHNYLCIMLEVGFGQRSVLWTSLKRFTNPLGLKVNLYKNWGYKHVNMLSSIPFRRLKHIKDTKKGALFFGVLKNKTQKSV